MKKAILTTIIVLTIFSCSKDDNNVEPENPIEEIVQIDVPEELTVYINVEIPENTTKEEYILIDNKNRELPINSKENIKAEANTIVSLMNKKTEKTIYIAYILKDGALSNKTSAKNSLKNGVCDNPTIVGVKSTARFILASILNPISVFHVGNSDRDAFYEMFKSNILCKTFSEEQILNIENAVKKLAEEGKDIAEVAVSNTIKTIIEPITGGLFADCWEIGTELLFNGQIELEAHPQQDYDISLIEFNENIKTNPYVIDKFTNVLPNGVIIKEATKLDNGNWKIKFDAYNSLPIPLAIRVGKLKDGTQHQIEPANNVTDYFIKSNGSSTIQMIKNGVTCEGFVNNAFDSYYSLDSGGLAIRSSDYDKVEVELEFNPENQYILFEGPNENDKVRIYHILESLSHIFDIIEIGDKIAKTEENDIYLELVNSLVTNSVVISFLQTNSPNLKEIQKIIGKELIEYVKNSIESGASSVLAKLLIEKNIEKTAVSKNLKIINTSLDVIDNINYLDAWSKIDNYTKTVKDYQLYIPSDVNTNTEPVYNPIPNNGATSLALEGDLTFSIGANTPTDATFKVYFGNTNNPTDFKVTSSPSNTYSGTQENTTYYWKVETISNTGSVLATSSIWSFTTLTNTANTEPAINPIPNDGATNITLNGNLSFTSGTNTPTDAVFRLYFDTNTNPSTVYDLGNQTNYNYSNLQENTTYFWYVETLNNIGSVIATSPIWSFTTENNTSGGVYDGDISFISQQEIDDFATLNYSSITGNLNIGNFFVFSSDMADLSGLNSLNSIGGDLQIITSCPLLTSLDGLQNINNIGGGVLISNNENLNDLIALNNLNQINGTLDIRHTKITNLNSLSNLTDITYDLKLDNNSQLINLNGLSNLSSIGGGIVIRNNTLLNSISIFNNLSGNINGDIRIHNSSLINLTGLENITSCEDLVISGNDFLLNLNSLSNIYSVNGLISILHNNLLSDISGLQNITTVSGFFRLCNLQSLSSLPSFSNLTSIGSHLSIDSNPILLEINGFSNLASINGSFQISNNQMIEIVNGFDSLNLVTGNLNIGVDEIFGNNNTSNVNLSNLCGLTNLIINGTLSGNYNVSNNLYNPTQQDIIDGNCSQ